MYEVLKKAKDPANNDLEIWKILKSKKLSRVKIKKLAGVVEE